MTTMNSRRSDIGSEEPKSDIEKQIDAFGKGANASIDKDLDKGQKKRGRKSKSSIPVNKYLFSLPVEMSNDIDKLCTRTTCLSRSDVIKASIVALQSLTKPEQIDLLEKYKSKK